MDSMKIIFTVLHILVCVLLIAVVLLQEGKDAGMKSISGASPDAGDSFFRKNTGRTKAAIFSKFTVVLAVLFLITTMVLLVL